jgi:hypothetical protein
MSENQQVSQEELAEIAKMQEYFKNLKNPNSNQNNGLKGSDKLKKIFMPREATEVFRILPVKTPNEVTQEAHFHVVEVNDPKHPKGKRYKKIYCLKHNGDLEQKLDENGKPVVDQEGKPVMIKPNCPLCNEANKYLSQQDKSIIGKKKEEMTEEQLKIKERNDLLFKAGVKWQAKKFHIIKGIDRGAEKDGVKFWRFKDNRKNQGTLDKLIPVLGEYMNYHKALFYDAENGADLAITVADTPFPGGKGGTYKDVSAISARAKIKLHNDPVVVAQWTSDPVTWKDVFTKAKAPNIDSEKYMQLLLEGNDPYWDDTDPSNKKWVFPNHPELEEAANTRNQNLEADDKPIQQPQSNVSINNVEPTDVKADTDDATHMGNVPTTEATVANDTSDDDPDFNDLPF